LGGRDGEEEGGLTSRGGTSGLRKQLRSTLGDEEGEGKQSAIEMTGERGRAVVQVEEDDTKVEEEEEEEEGVDAEEQGGNVDSLASLGRGGGGWGRAAAGGAVVSAAARKGGQGGQAVSKKKGARAGNADILKVRVVGVRGRVSVSIPCVVCQGVKTQCDRYTVFHPTGIHHLSHYDALQCGEDP